MEEPLLRWNRAQINLSHDLRRRVTKQRLDVAKEVPASVYKIEQSVTMYKREQRTRLTLSKMSYWRARKSENFRKTGQSGH